MKHFPTPLAGVLLAALAMAGVACSTSGTSTATVVSDVSAGLTVVLDAEACRADLAGIKGLTVANAVRVATTPSCVAALNAAVAAGQAAGVIK